MIQVTRLNHTQLYVNADLIEFIEESPDTVLTLTTGVRVVVTESAREIIDRVVAYRRRYTQAVPPVQSPDDGSRQLSDVMK